MSWRISAPFLDTITQHRHKFPFKESYCTSNFSNFHSVRLKFATLGLNGYCFKSSLTLAIAKRGYFHSKLTVELLFPLSMLRLYRHDQTPTRILSRNISIISENFLEDMASVHFFSKIVYYTYMLLLWGYAAGHEKIFWCIFRKWPGGSKETAGHLINTKFYTQLWVFFGGINWGVKCIFIAKGASPIIALIWFLTARIFLPLILHTIIIWGGSQYGGGITTNLVRLD